MEIQIRQNMASDQDLCYLHLKNSNFKQNEGKKTDIFVQFVKIEESTGHKWVKALSINPSLANHDNCHSRLVVKL